MRIVTIKDMIRKDVPIYYRKLYTGVAVIEFNEKPSDFRIDFSIEYKPTGQKELNVTFIDTLNYPLVPVVKEIKKYILELESSDGLPD